MAVQRIAYTRINGLAFKVSSVVGHVMLDDMLDDDYMLDIK